MFTQETPDTAEETKHTATKLATTKTLQKVKNCSAIKMSNPIFPLILYNFHLVHCLTKEIYY